MKKFWRAAAGGLLVGAATTGRGAEPPPTPAAEKAVITSQKVQVLDRGRRVEFTGNVVLVRGRDRLTADRMVTEEGSDLSRAWGRVVLQREEPGALWEATGDSAAYDTGFSSGTLWGGAVPARAVRRGLSASEGGDPLLTLWAGVLTFFEATPATSTAAVPMAEAREGVYLRAEESVPRPRRTEVWADRAVFDGREDRLAVEGAPRTLAVDIPSAPAGSDRPYARQAVGKDVREVSGDRMTYRPGDRRLRVEQRVQARVVFEDAAPAPEKKSRRGSRGVAR